MSHRINRIGYLVYPHGELYINLSYIVLFLSNFDVMGGRVKDLFRGKIFPLVGWSGGRLIVLKLSDSLKKLA